MGLTPFELYELMLKRFGEVPDPRYQPRKFRYYLELIQWQNLQQQ
jgi:hypothetical protein